MVNVKESISNRSESLELDRIFQDVLKLPQDSLKDELTMDDVELWDSLRHMELILAIEQKLAIELSFEEISQMGNLGEIRKIIAGKATT